MLCCKFYYVPKHRFSQPAGLGVVTAAMVGIDNAQVPDVMYRTVGELILGLASAECLDRRAMCNSAEYQQGFLT